MTNEELFEKLKYIQNTKCESTTLEIKRYPQCFGSADFFQDGRGTIKNQNPAL